MLSTVQQSLRPVRVRWQRQRLARAAASGLLAGGGAALAAVVGRRFGMNLPSRIEWVLPVVAAAFTVLWQLVRPPRWDLIARIVDARCGLQDRAITAWGFAHHVPLAGLEKLQVQEALQHLGQIDPVVVVPRRIPPRLASAVGVWLMAVTLGSLPPAAIDAQANSAQQQQQDIVNRQTAEQLEQSLLSQLRRLAELTGTTPPELKSLQRLPSDVAAKLDQLKQPGRSQPETLATLSEIQAAIANSSRQIGDATLLAHLDELGQALSAAESLQGVVDSLQQRELPQAAEQLKHLDAQQLSELEQQTLAEQLKPVVETIKAAGDASLAAAVEPMQEAFAQQDAARIHEAANRLAEAIQQQALRLAIQAELSAQMGQLSEAKGVSLSGGDNIAPSDESRQTWGQGKAGNPTSGQATDLQTTRQRENLTGVQGEGPTDRQSMRVEAGEGRAQRTLQPAFRPYEQAAEEVLRNEPLPLGYRQTIRDYFRSIRPE